jgi:hypothetical protein
MKKKIIFLALVMTPFLSFGQEEIETNDQFKNTIRYNFTNPVIFGIENVIIGYERVINPNRSFSIDFGLNKLPGFGVGSLINENNEVLLQDGGRNRGIHISADYRFYLKSENKFKAPRGVYIGPYYSFNSFNRTNNWELTTSEFDGIVGSDLGLRIHTIGAELGYQFQLSKRFMLDFVLFGPGMAIYNAQVDFDTTLDPSDSAILLQRINDLLSAKIPGFNTIIDGSGFEKSGVANINSLGYRFMINIGYRF